MYPTADYVQKEIHVVPLNSVDGPSGRYYKWGVESFVSVTTIIGDGIPKPGLNRWFLKQMAAYAASNRKVLATLTQVEAVSQLMGSLSSGNTKDGAAAIGSRVHAQAELISQGGTPPDLAPEEQPFIDRYREFLVDWSPVYVEAETTVFNRTHGYAGTLDAVVEIGGKRYVLDIKTGKAVWPEVALQLSAYRNAEFIGRDDGSTEAMFATQPRGLVLHLRPDKYVLYPADIGLNVFESFLSALDIHRWLKVYGKNVILDPWVAEEPTA
jgi:hypothetical protein